MAKEKIFVVDDEKDILEVLRYNLAREGFSSRPAPRHLMPGQNLLPNSH